MKQLLGLTLGRCSVAIALFGAFPAIAAADICSDNVGKACFDTDGDDLCTDADFPFADPTYHTYDGRVQAEFQAGNAIIGKSITISADDVGIQVFGKLAMCRQFNFASPNPQPGGHQIWGYGSNSVYIGNKFRIRSGDSLSLNSNGSVHVSPRSNLKTNAAGFIYLSSGQEGPVRIGASARLEAGWVKLQGYQAGVVIENGSRITGLKTDCRDYSQPPQQSIVIESAFGGGVTATKTLFSGPSMEFRAFTNPYIPSNGNAIKLTDSSIKAGKGLRDPNRWVVIHSDDIDISSSYIRERDFNPNVQITNDQYAGFYCAVQ